MNIPTYQVFNIDKDNTETCGDKNGYVKRTNYLLDSFRKRNSTNGEIVKDDGLRQYDGSYNLEQQKVKQSVNYSPEKYKEGFFNTKTISPTLIIIFISCLVAFLFVLYNIFKRQPKQNDT